MANVFIQRFKSFFLNFCTIFYVFKGFKNFFETFFLHLSLKRMLMSCLEDWGPKSLPLVYATALSFPFPSFSFILSIPFESKVS